MEICSTFKIQYFNKRYQYFMNLVSSLPTNSYHSSEFETWNEVVQLAGFSKYQSNELELHTNDLIRENVIWYTVLGPNNGMVLFSGFGAK